MTDTKLEPLPWFAFNVAEYITDTMRLTTESHGAYLLLMLDYYATCQPCPDDDFVLAAVAKLSEEAWAKHRKVLAPFFDIREGHWYHKRIEREMAEACHRLSQHREKSAAGGRARWAGKPESGTTAPKTPKGKATGKPVAQPAAKPVAKPGASTLNSNNTTTPSGRSSSDDDAPKAALQDEEVEGSFISKDFRPNPEQMAEAILDATEDEVAMQIRLFIAYNAERGSYSEDWFTTWALWWTRHLERKAKEAAKAPPRVVVNSNAPYVPTEKDYRDGLTRFARGQQWSFNALGPEPGHRGCKVPPALLEEFGYAKKVAVS